MSVDVSSSVGFREQPITQLLVKVATRCNIDCSYCYWFRDASVYDKPKLMSADVLNQLLLRIEQHAAKWSLVDFPITLHGGEPLLWGVENFRRLAEACDGIASRTGCDIPIAVTTNGVLVDDEWLDCFEACNISVAISLDGPAHIHDLHRRTFQGTGTHAAAERAARMLVSRNIGVSALAVCNPAYPPEQYVEFFAACGISSYDIMIPDATVDEAPPSIAAFYGGLFEQWLAANSKAANVDIRIVSDMITALLGNNSPTEGVGHKPIELCTVMTDGTVEAHDVLRIAGDGFTRTGFNIFDHAIDEVRNEPRWKAARDASINLCEKCRQCKFMNACGGGYLPHRFSRKNGYDNPSVYCDDLYAMFENMDAVLKGHLYVSKPCGERVGVGGG
ncbi:radical SAM protein [Bradyrhizobium diazoefficiens]|nr:radical SAM protein [Bradyrhizobium diazoefficiens]MBR0848588.1 radical SAM protein [Bradyrhizobium diazoefficiens]